MKPSIGASIAKDTRIIKLRTDKTVARILDDVILFISFLKIGVTIPLKKYIIKIKWKV